MPSGILAVDFRRTLKAKDHMNAIRSIAKKIPGLRRVYRSYINFADRQRLKGKAPDEVFTEIYNENRWGNNESISGPGSALDQTRAVRDRLPILLDELGAKTILDIPCGDFNWLKNLKLDDIQYTGADIVDEIVSNNKKNFQKENISFQNLNLLSDELPEVDLIFCRDCLVHFSFDDIWCALQNICRSGSKYLLTTTFTEHFKNYDIMTGQWRRINLQLKPFSLPKPIKIISEECTEANGEYADKSLGLWLVDDILATLNKISEA